MVGLEILEDELLDERFVHALIELKRQGYRLALDDFQYTVSAERLLGLVDVVKLDLVAMGHDRLKREVARLKSYGVALLAEKVETREDHAWCVEHGCDLFQGFFFCQPELVHKRGIAANRAAMLEVVAALQDPTVQLTQLDRMISRDVAMSFRLLRYINSAFFGLRFEVSSIGQALALLGIDNLRRWSTLTVLAQHRRQAAGADRDRARPRALLRARRQAAPRPAPRRAVHARPVLGDRRADRRTDRGRDRADPVPGGHARGARVPHRREGRALLNSVTALEGGDFDRARKLVPGAGELYLQALMWANDAAGPLFDQSEPAAARPHAA